MPEPITVREKRLVEKYKEECNKKLAKITEEISKINVKIGEIEEQKTKYNKDIKSDTGLASWHDAQAKMHREQMKYGHKEIHENDAIFHENHKKACERDIAKNTDEITKLNAQEQELEENCESLIKEQEKYNDVNIDKGIRVLLRKDRVRRKDIKGHVDSKKDSIKFYQTGLTKYSQEKTESEEKIKQYKEGIEKQIKILQDLENDKENPIYKESSVLFRIKKESAQRDKETMELFLENENRHLSVAQEGIESYARLLKMNEDSLAMSIRSLEEYDEEEYKEDLDLPIEDIEDLELEEEIKEEKRQPEVVAAQKEEKKEEQPVEENKDEQAHVEINDEDEPEEEIEENPQPEEIKEEAPVKEEIEENPQPEEIKEEEKPEEIIDEKPQAEETIVQQEEKKEDPVENNIELEKNPDIKLSTKIQNSIDELEASKTFVNSGHYKNLIISLKDLQNADFNDKDAIKEKLENIGRKVDKYLNHKAADGVKANTYKKLAAVQKTNEWLADALKGFKVNRVADYKTALDEYKAIHNNEDTTKLPEPGGDQYYNQVLDARKKNDPKIKMSTVVAADECLCSIILRANEKDRESLVNMRKEFNLGLEVNAEVKQENVQKEQNKDLQL